LASVSRERSTFDVQLSTLNYFTKSCGGGCVSRKDAREVDSFPFQKSEKTKKIQNSKQGWCSKERLEHSNLEFV